jgi:GNAT superfamily N-acetyltransferase
MPKMSNSNPSLRVARKSDSGALARLAGELGYPTTGGEMRDRLDKVLSRSHHRVFVAELDSLVGWIHVSLTHSLESGPCVEIRGLVVAELHRGSGIGTQLVAIAERWAEQKGCRRIRVRTNILRNRAGVFYEKLGFQLTKTQEVFDKVISVGVLKRR